MCARMDTVCPVHNAQLDWEGDSVKIGICQI
jgi:hypothetical protein